MKILVIGGGAREHTIVWKLAQSPKAEKIYVAPGNAGTAQIAENVNIKAEDITGLGKFAASKRCDLTVVGPEAPMALGVVDHFEKMGIPIFGPTKSAARIESSKVFSKELMQRYGIPCAGSVSFSSREEARKYIEKQPAPLVVKADGLAAGKGVVVAETIPQALKAVDDIMGSRIFGGAGDKVIVEEFLTGREMSAFIFTDGETIVPMVFACDYKPVYDGNKGPNTGGMGSYTPPFFFTKALADTVMETIMKPTVKAMRDEGIIYKGVLYGGLMINNNGVKVLEFNARFGDPETQIVLPRLKTDLVDIMMAVVENRLDKVNIEWSEDACVGVVMASGGYPGSYKTDLPITGLDKLDPDIMVFHAGSKTGPVPGQVLTGGGRVLSVVARGKTTNEARQRVYDNLPRINFDGCYYRRDIALFKE
ncbi:phosphoribosylamine--glycine ligase [Chloroflexota bacterium]